MPIKSGVWVGYVTVKRTRSITLETRYGYGPCISTVHIQCNYRLRNSGQPAVSFDQQVAAGRAGY